MNRLCLLFTLLSSTEEILSQVSITNCETTITENFNSLPGSPDNSTFSWTDNSTLSGWYISTSTCRIESSASGMDNTGGIYTITSGSDRSLGSKASTSSGTLQYGFRLKNTSNQTINSIEVSFYGEQWSIAENESNVNQITFSYQVGSAVSSLSSGSWTSVPALSFSQLYTSSQSSGMGGSNCSGNMVQCLSLDGNASANRIRISACFDVVLVSGNEIFLRWTDADTPANDHHLQIDEVSVSAHSVSCSVALPVTWGTFSGNSDEDGNDLFWQTLTEANASHFEIERRTAATDFVNLGTVACKGESLLPTDYYFRDESPVPNELNYYRLIQYDRNGAFEIGEVIAVDPAKTDSYRVGYDKVQGRIRFTQALKAGTTLSCHKLSGEVIFQSATTETAMSVEAMLDPGMYYLIVVEPNGRQRVVKLFVG